MEYSESRIYLPGDDIRSIDWRVTARTGHTHTKLFHEDRERPVFFVVDLGGHMRFGTLRAFKSVVAAEAASLLAWAAVENVIAPADSCSPVGARSNPASQVDGGGRSGSSARWSRSSTTSVRGMQETGWGTPWRARAGLCGPGRWPS